jgi:hypothetical protein
LLLRLGGSINIFITNGTSVHHSKTNRVSVIPEEELKVDRSEAVLSSGVASSRLQDARENG